MAQLNSCFMVSLLFQLFLQLFLGPRHSREVTELWLTRSIWAISPVEYPS